MKISEIGEKEIIKTIKNEINTCDEVINEIGEDDCALLDYGEKRLIYTTDLLKEPSHFPKQATYYDIGWKSIAVNLSDIASMGGTPLFSITSIAIPDIDKKQLKQLSKGMSDCSKKHGLCQTGGDVNKSEETIINTSIIAESKKHPLLRKNTSPGQYLAVTGEVGTTALAIKSIKEKIDLPKKTKKHALNKLLRPEPRVEEGKKLADHKGNAAIDISDGLFISIKQLTAPNNYGAKIDSKRIPINPLIKNEIKEHKIDKLDLLEIGGDYELLFTTNQKEIIEELNATEIGKITKEEKILIDGKKEKIKGYRHF